MKLIFTKSALPLSVLIRHGLNEPISHFGIVFDNGIVFHSNLLGTHIEWYKTFAKHCEIMYDLEYPMDLATEEKVYQNILNTYDGLGYDYGAFFYFIYRGILKRIFGIPFPKTNEWQDGSKFLCTELAKCLPDEIVSAKIKSEDLSITSPYQLFLRIMTQRAERI